MSDPDKAVLDFAKQTWHFHGERDSAIVKHLGYSPTTYFQKLNRIIDDPAALEHDAQTVRRYQRIREQGRGITYGKRGSL